MAPPLLTRSKLTALGLAAGVLLVGGAISAMLVATRSRPEQKGLDAIVPRAVVIHLDAIEVQPSFQGFGVAAAFTRADVPSRISSTVLHVPDSILAGAPVSAGQVLVELDPQDALRQLESATQQIAMLDAQLLQLATEEASLVKQVALAEEDAALAKADLDRVRSASDAGAAREREVDRARQAVLAAERSTVILRERLAAIPARRGLLEAQRGAQEALRLQAVTDVDRCRIESPVGGIIQRFDLKPGEMVRAGDLVARVIDSTRIEVPLQLPAGVRPLVRVGDEVEFRSTDRREMKWRAEVSRIAPEDDQRNRTFTVWAERVQDPFAFDAIAPGMFIEGIVTSSQRERLTVVPRRAIRADRVFIVNDGRVQHVDIQEAFPVSGPFPGAEVSDREWVALRSGPPPGSVVVLDAARVLPDGGRIEAVAPSAGRRPEPAP
ncbi:MAG: HlyD family efflux transporter periplasmic adaptor subunit [Phycisphaeraceae bacterium]|nr:HlyD family efflux transporter periplasmic adaptor subunit [Phycisphaeraceae bacterium]